MEILRIAIQSFSSLAVLFCLTRLTGKCSISQLEPFDYINSITIGNLAAGFAVSERQNWALHLTALVICGLITAGVGWLRCKSLALRTVADGRPLIVFAHGTIEKQNLLKAKMDLNTFLAQCRLAGYFDLDQIEYAILETNGQISFLPKAAARPATPEDLNLSPAPEGVFTSLILDGKLQKESLQHIGKNEQWLHKQLHTAGIGQISEVFYAGCDVYGNFRACRMPKSGL
ncbi:MAG: DUF421 domain-containing protein [Faecalibacterium sp.]|nr:DUF421 domain-containing protein [Faecalibacterium sp.]